MVSVSFLSQSGELFKAASTYETMILSIVHELEFLGEVLVDHCYATLALQKEYLYQANLVEKNECYFT